MTRCKSTYSLQVRCELPAGHSGTHGHSFFARYWEDDDRPMSPFVRRALAHELPAKVVAR